MNLTRKFPSSLVSLSQRESKCEMTDLYENATACGTHFHMKGIALKTEVQENS